MARPRRESDNATRDYVVEVRNRRITIAVEGHAWTNSSDARTLAGTSARSTISNPNFGKNRSAVVVSR